MTPRRREAEAAANARRRRRACRREKAGRRAKSPEAQRTVSPSGSPRPGGQIGVSSSLLLPLHQVGKLDSWEDFQDRQAMTLFTTRSTAGTTEPMSSAPTANGICSLAISPAPRHGTLSHSSATAWGTIRCQFMEQFGVSSSLLLPLHQVGKLDSWEDFQDRQAMTLFTTRSTAGTTEPMSSAPTANGICSLAISPAPRHSTLCALRLLDVQPFSSASQTGPREQFGVRGTIRCQFIIIASLASGTIRCQFIIIASLASSR